MRNGESMNGGATEVAGLSGEGRGLARFTGGCLLLGGVLAALVNLVLTPLLPTDGGTVAVSTSAAFALRMPLAAAVVALTALGLIGLYLVQAHRLRLGALAFLVAGIGSLMVFHTEVVQVTLIRDLALATPETLERLEREGRLGLYDLSFMVAVGTFTVGWLAVLAVTLRARVVDRRGPLTVLAALFLIPILGGLAGIWGAVLGNLALGAGWALLGHDVRTAAADP